MPDVSISFSTGSYSVTVVVIDCGGTDDGYQVVVGATDNNCVACHASAPTQASKEKMKLQHLPIDIAISCPSKVEIYWGLTLHELAKFHPPTSNTIGCC